MNNKDTVTPIQKQITEVLDIQLTEAMSRSYNLAVEHCMDIVKRLNDEMFPDTPSYTIINKELQKLIK